MVVTTVRGDAIELTVDGPDGPRTVRVSNPDKVYFPELGVTKADVVRYFLAVGDGIVRALHERPTMLERWPGGVVPGAKLSVWMGERGAAFFQRRVPRGAPDWVERARIAGPAGSDDEVVCPTELAVVLWAANLGTLRFHPWPVRRADIDRPDELRIDLDPQTGTDFHDAVRVAVELRGLLDEVGMEGFPKTSGGRGVHVYVRIPPNWPLSDVVRALGALGRELVRRMPDGVTMARRKQDRGRRVFLDHNQMAGTIASAYSIRPGPHAMVSAPVTWDELTAVSPHDLNLTTMPARFAAIGDLHARMAGRRFSIAPLLEMSDRDARDGSADDAPDPPGRPETSSAPTRVRPPRSRDRA
jgi:DNA ligase D-like protein (predicted polymerase)